jgi:hypothetical protein
MYVPGSATNNAESPSHNDAAPQDEEAPNGALSPRRIGAGPVQAMVRTVTTTLPPVQSQPWCTNGARPHGCLAPVRPVLHVSGPRGASIARTLSRA